MFSGVVQITDLDDYIAPSQECIKPLGPKKDSNPTSTANKNAKTKANVRIRRADRLENEVDEEKPVLTKAQITIADCLACSGCVTSAETVLITQQSIVEFEKSIELKTSDPTIRIAVSISSQSLASLAAHFNLPSASTLRKLVAFFKTQMQADYVFDMRTAQSLSVLAGLREFVARKSNVPLLGDVEYSTRPRQTTFDGILPIICGACPGWVCYAEKVHSNLLSHLSRARSAQQIQGAVLKRCCTTCDASSLRHFAIMSCFDKKLESSRADFAFEAAGVGVKEVDCVLTSGEVLELLTKRSFAMETSEERDCDDILDVIDSSALLDCVQPPETGWLIRGSNVQLDADVRHSMACMKSIVLHPSLHVSSGGYANYILKFASRYYRLIAEASSFRFVPKRNADFQECVITRGVDGGDDLQPQDGPKQLRFAFAYGLRNIQNVVQALKRSKHCEYDYVEMMACPSGCLNGGGQIRVNLNDVDSRMQLSSVQRAFLKSDTSSETCKPHNKPVGAESDACGSDACNCQAPLQADTGVLSCTRNESISNDEDAYWHAVEVLYYALARRSIESVLFFTDYHAVEKTVQPLALKW